MKLEYKKIISYTGYSKEEYEVLLVETLMMCLSDVSITSQHLQLLIIDTHINNWFLQQVSKANQDYIKWTAPYKHLQKETLKKGYLMILKIFTKNYPKALIKRVKLKNIKSFSVRNN